jgi:hypothetical protein
VCPRATFIFFSAVFRGFTDFLTSTTSVNSLTATFRPATPLRSSPAGSAHRGSRASESPHGRMSPSGRSMGENGNICRCSRSSIPASAGHPVALFGQVCRGRFGNRVRQFVVCERVSMPSVRCLFCLHGPGT